MHNFPSTSATISFPGRLNSTSSLAIVSLKRGWMLGRSLLAKLREM
ncbi:unnamed protein product, partial [Vitis vinifera]|uniref:Uncharacterized protein n=1 Tax=Vitis vinifera TaxID=29760 RepID=D7U5M9_VITVI